MLGPLIRQSPTPAIFHSNRFIIETHRPLVTSSLGWEFLDCCYHRYACEDLFDFFSRVVSKYSLQTSYARINWVVQHMVFQVLCQTYWIRKLRDQLWGSGWNWSSVFYLEPLHQRWGGVFPWDIILLKMSRTSPSSLEHLIWFGVTKLGGGWLLGVGQLP